jgi:arylsulfatase A-like enzyme
MVKMKIMLKIFLAVFVLFISTLLFNMEVSASTLPTGLVGYWRFDENSGLSAADSSGNNNNGSLKNGPTWTAGKMKNSISLDGIDDYIDAGSNDSFDLTDLTIAAWIYSNGVGTQPDPIVSHRRHPPAGDANYQFQILDDTGTLNFVYKNNTWINANATTKVAFNQWQQVAVTWSNTANQANFYINGQPAGSVITGVNILPNPLSQLWIGIGAETLGQYFNGKIDNLRIYNKPLTTQEVKSIYDFESALRPNIIVIMTDDQEDGPTMNVMTNLKNLIAKEGIAFTNSFVENSICCPSRATFVTGQYSHNIGIYDNRNITVNGITYTGGYGPLRFTDNNTLPVWLQEAGYHTAMIGKYLNGYSAYGTQPYTYVPPGWDRWFARGETTWARYFNYTIDDQGVLKNYGSAESDYLTDVQAAEVISFIQSKDNSNQPFFIKFTPSAPHGEVHSKPDGTLYMAPPVPAPRHNGKFSNMTMPKNPSFNEADVSDKPSYWEKTYPLLNQTDIASIENKFRKRLESMLAVDEAVGQIINVLQATGKLDNTIIIFTSDNGYFLGEHRRPEGKSLVYEPSIRVPLIIRGPGIPRNETRPQLVNNVDLPATIIDLAKANPGRTLDGRSFMPIINNQNSSWRSTLLFQQFLNWWYQPNFGLYHTVRTDNFKYIENEMEGGGFEYELYDLARDPYELENKHNDPLYTPVINGLKNTLAIWQIVLAQAAG